MPVKPRITKDNAKEMQAKSVAKRKENQRIRDIIREDLEKRLLKNGGKSIGQINQTAIDLAIAGEGKSRNYIAKATGLYDDEQQQTGTTVNINITGAIEKKEDIDELV